MREAFSPPLYAIRQGVQSACFPFERDAGKIANQHQAFGGPGTVFGGFSPSEMTMER